jgi:hypothetical protein
VVVKVELVEVKKAGRDLLGVAHKAGGEKKVQSLHAPGILARRILNSDAVRLPNAHSAIVDIAKLTEYCLNPAHPKGRHKARVFDSRLGITAKDAGDLRTALVRAAWNGDAVPGVSDEYGARYVIDFEMKGPKGRGTVRSTWIVRGGEENPRLTSCFVL